MRILKKNSGTVSFTDHKLLRACLEARLEDKSVEVVDVIGYNDQGMTNERDYRENHQ